MTFQFPNTPTLGQTFAPAGGPTYVWDGSAWRAIGPAAGPATVLVSDTPPPNPGSNQLWWDSNSARLHIWYSDADSSQWVQIFAGPTGATGPEGPAGPIGPVGPTPSIEPGLHETTLGVASTTISVLTNAIQTSGYSLAGDGGGALYKRVVSEPAHAGKVQSMDGAWWELAEKVVRPQMFGALGAGDDRTALLGFLGFLGNGVNGVIDRTHEISAELSIASKSNFRLSGTGAIKVANGITVGSGYGGLLVYNCTGFVLEDFTVDGNRANRTPVESSAHLVNIRSCSDFTIQRVRAINGVTDGFYFASSTPATKSTHSHDFAVVDCIAENNFRQGMSIIQGYNVRIEGGRYVNTIGTAPQAGIDLESNVGDPNYSLESISIVDVRFEANAGYGLQVSSQSRPRDIRIVRPRFIDNILGAVLWGGYSGGLIEDAYISGATASTTRGVIDVAANADVGYLRVVRPVFRNMTFPSTKFLIYVHSSSAGHVHIDGLDVDTCAAVATINGDYCSFTNCNIRGITAANGIITSASPDNLVVKGGRISNFVESAVTPQGPNATISDLFLEEPTTNTSTGCIRMLSTGGRVERNRIYRAASAAGYGIKLEAAYTSCQDNIIVGFTGNPIASSGAGATETVGLLKRNIGNGVRLTEN